jgi:hypothetical protein
MKFTVEIELGNDAMQTPQDVARTIEYVAKTYLNPIPYFAEGESIHMRIYDRNGNTCGHMDVEGDSK